MFWARASLSTLFLAFSTGGAHGEANGSSNAEASDVGSGEAARTGPGNAAASGCANGSRCSRRSCSAVRID
jgi:hypothetical protein